MSACDDFKALAYDRLELVDVLIGKQEWWLAAYMMGFVLECTLKAGACKALNLEVYPAVQTTKKEKITSYFLTHDFDMLLVISGASDIFGISGIGAESWSGFTQEFQGHFTALRYEISSKYDEKKVTRMYGFLTKDPDGIIPLMESQRKW
jgi:hypothetical protein